MSKEKLINTNQLCSIDGIKAELQKGIEEGVTTFIIDRNIKWSNNIEEILEALKSVDNWHPNTELQIYSINSDNTEEALKKLNEAFSNMNLINVSKITLTSCTGRFSYHEINNDHTDGLSKIYKTLANKGVSKIKFDLESTDISSLGILDLVTKANNLSSHSNLEIILPNYTLLEIQNDLQRLNINYVSKKDILTQYPEMTEYTYSSDSIIVIGQEYYNHDNYTLSLLPY